MNEDKNQLDNDSQELKVRKNKAESDKANKTKELEVIKKEQLNLDRKKRDILGNLKRNEKNTDQLKKDIQCKKDMEKENKANNNYVDQNLNRANNNNYN